MISVALAGPPPLSKILKSRMDQDFTVDDMFEDMGLQILGAERHDSLRIDRQLRGSAGARVIPDPRSSICRSKRT